MKKVAILGIENSHAWNFAAELAGIDGKRKYNDVELIGFYGNLETEEGRIGRDKLAERSTCTKFAEHYNDFLEEADAVMITARHGGNHLKYAKAYLEKGIPVWIDKPICASVEDVLELVALAKMYNAPIWGGSSVIFSKEIETMAAYREENKDTVTGGHVTAPINMVNEWGNFWFYAQHLIQMMTTVFGNDVRSVSANSGENYVQALYHYDDFTISAYFGAGYTMTVYNGNYKAEASNVSLAGCHVAELESFYEVMKTGKGVTSYKDFITPVFIIDATIKAFEQKCEVEINVPEV